MVMKRVRIAEYPTWRDRIALGFGGLNPECVFVRAKVNDPLSGIFKSLSAASFTSGHPLWAHTFGIEKRFADVMMGEEGSRVFVRQPCEDLDQLSRFMVIVFRGCEECADWLGNYKLRLEVITDGADFPDQRYVWTRSVYQACAEGAEVVDDEDDTARKVAATLSNLLNRGKGMLRVKVQDAIKALRGVAVPERAVVDAGGEHVKGEGGFTALGRADHEQRSATLEPGVKQVFTGFRWRWSVE